MPELRSNMLRVYDTACSFALQAHMIAWQLQRYEVRADGSQAQPRQAAVTHTRCTCRDGYGEERYEKVELQKRVAAEFAHFSGSHFHMVNALRGIEDVHQDVCRVATSVLSQRDAGSLPLRELWGSEPDEIADQNVVV